MKLYFVRTVHLVEPNGVGYVDDYAIVPHYENIDENVDEFINILNNYITDNQSIILRREDLVRFVDTFVDESGYSKKRLLNKLRVKLRQEFDVCRIRFNPRTLALQDRSYIIHKRIYGN